MLHQHSTRQLSICSRQRCTPAVPRLTGYSGCCVRKAVQVCEALSIGDEVAVPVGCEAQGLPLAAVLRQAAVDGGSDCWVLQVGADK